MKEHPGHDTMFYNVLRKAAEQAVYIDEVFGDQFHYFRHALVVASRHLDVTLAVSESRLQDYVENLIGQRPDYLFTHVTRMVPSKGLWRDLLVMKYLDEEFQ